MTPVDVSYDHQSSHDFSCDQCGSDLHFDPKSQNLQCISCGQTDHDQRGAAHSPPLQEQDFQDALKDNAQPSDLETSQVITCSSCGAQTELVDRVHAEECPFCAATIVTQACTNTQLKPKGLVPFQLSQVEARQSMKDWFGNLWFAPSDLQDLARDGRKLNGIYVPYWTFDAQTHSQYTGARGTHYYVTQTSVVDGKTVTRQVQKTRWRSVAGQVSRFFDDILVLAAQNLPQKQTQALTPWDLSQLAPYDSRYLAGFRAQAYQVDLQSGFTQALAHIDKMVLRDVKYDIGGDAQRVHNVQTDVSHITYKHILLPIWVASFRYRGKAYQVVINAQTGRVQGQRPFSVWKIAGAVLVGIMLVAGITAAAILKEQGLW